MPLLVTVNHSVPRRLDPSRRGSIHSDRPLGLGGGELGDGSRSDRRERVKVVGLGPKLPSPPGCERPPPLLGCFSATLEVLD